MIVAVPGSPLAVSVLTVHVGRARPLGPEAVPSGFVKTAVAGAVRVRTLGLEGDEQADLRVHGGVDKAVYGYAVLNYPRWRADFPAHAALFAPGGMGENLAIEGLDESGVCIGDVHEIGAAQLIVSQPRQPCFKLALRFNDEQLVHAMVVNGRSGWYYRVAREGVVQPGDAVRCVERPNPAWTIARFVAGVSRRAFSQSEWAELSSLGGLAQSWRERAGIRSA
jgi:MOSC domain-containing protein YiiM